MKPTFLSWLAISLIAFSVLRADSADPRFSQTLNTEDRAAAGLTRLSSDEVAVIDALVRRDTITRAAASNSDHVAATFSQRLTERERLTAGLSKLSTTELPKLDAFVDRHQNAKLARILLAPPTYLARSSRVTPTEAKKEREIHGSYSLSYGFGSGGYSEKTGSMVLNFEDPARGYSISIGYSESHIKGGHGYYRDGYYRDPFYDPLRGGPLDNATPFQP